MRIRSIAFVVALVMALALPASAVAAPKEGVDTFHGTWTDGMFGGCTTVPPLPGFGTMTRFDAQGPDESPATWDVSIDGDHAVANLVNWLRIEGQDYWVFAGVISSDQWQVLNHNGDNFHLRLAADPEGLGSQIDLVLTGHQLRFRIQPYPLPGFIDCQFAESYGVLDRAG